jgi:hypothetical protein
MRAHAHRAPGLVADAERREHQGKQGQQGREAGELTVSWMNQVESEEPALYPGGEKDLGKRPSRETKSWVAPRLGGSRQTSSCCHGRRGSLMASRVYSGSGSSRAGREMKMQREVGDEDEGRPEGRNE